MRSSLRSLQPSLNQHRGKPRILSALRVPRATAGTLVSAAKLQFGQPVYETHPHLLKAGEVTPGISAVEYAKRRSRLAEALPTGSIAIIAASDVKYRSGAVFYEFHQDPNFFYLTGFNEPEALAVIEKTGSGTSHTFHLYLRPKDPKAERWEGSRSGIQAAQDVFNADEAGDINQISTILPQIVGDAREVYTDLPATLSVGSAFTRYFYGASDSKAEAFSKLLQLSKVKPLRPYMNELRVFKSEAEISNMRRAGQASGRAFTEAMRNHWTREKDLGAFLDHAFKMFGCDGSAYVPVIAGGRNALSIHYVRNDAILEDGQLVLADAGGEYGGYVTDITRTWPVNGKFCDAQKDLYEAVLKVQRTCVSLCHDNANMSLDKLHGIAEDGLRDGLQQLGFDFSKNSLEDVFPHHVGHYVGLDVHDAPGYPRTGKLKTGQCITIEPGVYVTDDERWPNHFRGMGIRIEDSVCIQEENPIVLTTEAVKEIDDIEALRA